MHSTVESSYKKPGKVGEAIRYAVEANGDFRYLAGGTDLLANRFQGNDMSGCLIDLSGIRELHGASLSDNHLEIGPLVTLDELAALPEVQAFFPALAEAANAAATPVLRRTATIGGNILCENRCIFYNQSAWWREAVGYCLKCNGDICIATGGARKCYSKFVSDTAPVLIACKASVLIVNENGEQWVDLASIYTGDGLAPTSLTPTAMISSIALPLADRWSCVFMKLRPRRSMDFTSLTTAVARSATGKIRIVIGGVDPKPVLVSGSDADREELIRKAIKTPRIVDNDTYPRLYRKDMIGVYLRRSFERLDL